MSSGGHDPEGPPRRRACIAELGAWLASIRRTHPTRVAVDGPDAAGKSTLAGELAAVLRSVHGRHVVSVSADDFLAPADRRHARGRLSAEGYFEDSVDVIALRDELLRPLGQAGTRRYRRRVYDVEAERVVREPHETAQPDTLVLVDGVFLQRPVLAGCWEARIWVTASESARLSRALARDAPRFGSTASVRERYTRRYLPAQRLYVAEVDPARTADVVVDNEDPSAPRIRWSRRDPRS
jgi:uridine kinase